MVRVFNVYKEKRDFDILAGGVNIKIKELEDDGWIIKRLDFYQCDGGSYPSIGYFIIAEKLDDIKPNTDGNFTYSMTN